MAQSQHSSSLLDTGSLSEVKQARIAIVYTEWNDKIVSEQIKGCERIAEANGAVIVEKLAVPGSFEIPFACKQLFMSYDGNDNAPEAIIAFGAVIRGGTPHFEYVCKAVTEGIVQLNLMLPIPTIFGVLTLDTEEQAWERLGGTHGHKGEEAAITALKMIKNSRAKGF
jgi:6,7-dimethyl-8-ribityllumazine synthase